MTLPLEVIFHHSMCSPGNVCTQNILVHFVYENVTWRCVANFAKRQAVFHPVLHLSGQLIYNINVFDALFPHYCSNGLNLYSPFLLL